MASTLERWRIAAGRVLWVLAVCYVLLIGGQYYGLVVFEINLLSAVLLCGGTGAWLWWRWRRKRGFAETTFDIAIFAGLGAAGISAIFSIDASRSVGALWLGAVWAGLFWFTADVLAEGVSRRLVALSMVVALTVIALIALAQAISFWADWLALGLLPQTAFRVAAANPTAGMLNFLLPLLAAFYLEARSRGTKAAVMVLLAVAATAMFYTSSRSGWLGAVVGAATFAQGYWRQIKGRRWQWAGAQSARRFFASKKSLTILVGGAIALGAAGYLAYRQTQHVSHATNLKDARSVFWVAAMRAFESAPLTGTGLFTYASEFLSAPSIPPQPIYNQAHGLPFNLLAETGLLGAAAFVLGLAAFYRRAQVRDVWQVGAMSALAATLAHSVFETPYVNPPVMALSAMAAAMLATSQQGGWRNGLVMIPVAALGALGVWMYAPSHMAVGLGNEGRWQESAAMWEEAVGRDPFSPLVKTQAALAAQQAGNASRAVVLYQDALLNEPGYSLHWANLAAAHFALGDLESALGAMRRARLIAPDAGALAQAESVWLGATYAPTLEEGDVRELRLAQWAAGELSADSFADDAAQLRALFDRGDAYGWQVTQLADIEVALGNLDRADYLTRYAKAMRAGNEAQLNFALGDLAAARSDEALAAWHYRQAFEALPAPNEYGASNGYGWLVFVRESMRVTLADGITPSMPEHLQWRARALEKWHGASGEAP